MTQTTLVIHPGNDPSTQYLQVLYENLNAEVITGGVSRRDLLSLASRADRVVACGHGSELGLFGGGQFPHFMVIDYSWAPVLRERDDNVLLWCFASQFAASCGLRGWGCEMHISEPVEAEIYLKESYSPADVEESNRAFAEITGRSIHLPLSTLHETVRTAYGRLDDNPVVRFNLERLQLLGNPPLASAGGCSTSGNHTTRDSRGAGDVL